MAASRRLGWVPWSCNISWGEAYDHGVLPGYRATMTPPKTPPSCTIWGLSAAEIFRSLCKTQIVTETSRMPKMMLIYPCRFSTVLNHGPEEHSDPVHPAQPPWHTVPKYPWKPCSGPKGRTWDEYLTWNFFFGFLLCLGKNSAGAKQCSSCGAPLPAWEYTEWKVDMRAHGPSSCHQARPRADWL